MSVCLCVCVCVRVCVRERERDSHHRVDATELLEELQTTANEESFPDMGSFHYPSQHET